MRMPLPIFFLVLDLPTSFSRNHYAVYPPAAIPPIAAAQARPAMLPRKACAPVLRISPFRSGDT